MKIEVLVFKILMIALERTINKLSIYFFDLHFFPIFDKIKEKKEGNEK